jgi:lipid-A-disaccharide synthase
MITILPFEKDWYRQRGVGHVEYVGSPLAMEVHPSRPKADFCEEHGIDPARPIIALLPGSRHKEIVRILPVMMDSAIDMARERKDLQFVIALASGKSIPEVKKVLHTAEKRSSLPEGLFIIAEETFDALNASDAAAVTSGTATLETAIIGTPLVIVYKTSKINYKLLRPLISVEHFGLVNLIAGERIAAEQIQDEFTPETLSGELFRLLEPDGNQETRLKLAEAVAKLGHGGASKRAAEAILKLIKDSGKAS